MCGVCLCHPTRKGGSPHIPDSRSRKGYIYNIYRCREGMFPPPKTPGYGNKNGNLPSTKNTWSRESSHHISRARVSLVMGKKDHSFPSPESLGNKTILFVSLSVVYPSFFKEFQIVFSAGYFSPIASASLFICSYNSFTVGYTPLLPKRKFSMAILYFSCLFFRWASPCFFLASLPYCQYGFSASGCISFKIPISSI